MSEEFDEFFLQVSTATPDREAAVRLARSAVSRHLAAGAQITGPVETAFWHLGEFGTGTEWRLSLTTVEDRYDELEALLLTEHPWDRPEIAATVVVRAADHWLEWAHAATRPS